jgi:hypothetical protein
MVIKKQLKTQNLNENRSAKKKSRVEFKNLYTQKNIFQNQSPSNN